MTLHSLSRALVLALFVATAAVRHAAAADNVALAAQARAVLKNNCQACHSGPGSESGYDFDVLKVDTLKAARNKRGAILVPGKVVESRLFVRAGIDKTMPPDYAKDQPTEADLAVLKKWIEAGAPAFPDASRRFLTLTAELTALRDDLRKAAREDRPFLRYFTLTNVYNNPAVTEDELHLTRAALAKAINSLSRKPVLVQPRAVDKDETIFAIDVRELDWDGGLWRAIIREYPYGLNYAGHRDAALRRIDDDLRDLASGGNTVLAPSTVAAVRADWFIATATRPPLYHTLLHIPETAGELETHLGVNIARNFGADKLARAGFARSGVSNQNRLVERHDSGLGYYWKSYDFKANNGRAKLTRFPLGPVTLLAGDERKFLKQAFTHDGGEIIFSLPNGLQGYMLVDGKDRRIDEGPIQVVSDIQKTSGTSAIVNGLSCMSCHDRGMLPFTDSIRDGSAVFGDAEEKVRRLYPEAKKMAAMVEADSRRFVAAAEQLTAPYLKPGPGAKEPVGAVARAYRLTPLGFLDLRAVARELDFEKPEDFLAAIGREKLKELGLDTLLQKGVVISRAEWEAVDSVSLMQAVVRALGATPIK